MILDPNEITALAARYGAPQRWTRVLDVSEDYVLERQKREQKKRGEIVLAMPRPNGRVLLHTKDFYPVGAYRLLSGGIELGERVEDAARREIREETELDAALELFLGVIEYEFRHGNARATWVSYVFQTAETHATPHTADASEGISEFREVEWRELERVAEALEQLGGDWQDWGRFRAIVHRLVLESIADLGFQI